jgi:MFS family permease
MKYYFIIGLSVWLHAADSLVTATLAPAVVADLGGVAYVNWLITLYEAGAVVSGAAIAAACQRYGLKRAFLAGAWVYCAGCVVAGVSVSMASILSGRLLQGVGGGALLSLSYVATYQWFEERRWARIFGIVAAVWGGGSLLGPLIGGLFADHFGWRMAFWVFAALSAGLAALMLILLPAEPQHPGRMTRWPVSTIAVLSGGTLLIAEAGVAGSALLALAACAAGTAMLYASARLDRKATVRLLPLEILNLRTPLGSGLAMVFALSVATTGFWAYGPLLLRTLFGIDPLISGYILAIEAIAWSLGTVAVSGRPRFDDRTLIRTGVLCICAGVAGFAVAVPLGSLYGLAACAILQGVGFGIGWPFIVTRCVRLGGDEPSLASAAPATLQRIGYAVGTAFAGVLANMSGLGSGMQASSARIAGFWVFAGFMPMLLIGIKYGWRFTHARNAGPLS